MNQYPDYINHFITICFNFALVFSILYPLANKYTMYLLIGVTLRLNLLGIFYNISYNTLFKTANSMYVALSMVIQEAN